MGPDGPATLAKGGAPGRQPVPDPDRLCSGTPSRSAARFWPMGTAIEFWLFLPQMRMTMQELVGRARAAEASGFGGIAGMDHLVPPGAEAWPMFDRLLEVAPPRWSSERV